jgi:large subunit ribosomal protein L22
MAWIAKHRFARISERKARLVIDMIRGRGCDEAVSMLDFSHKRAGSLVRTVLKSAMANAVENEADTHRLFISEARVDPGPIIKRWRPKDRGRAHPIQKRTCHIVISVDEG